MIPLLVSMRKRYRVHRRVESKFITAQTRLCHWEVNNPQGDLGGSEEGRVLAEEYVRASNAFMDIVQPPDPGRIVEERDKYKLLLSKS